MTVDAIGSDANGPGERFVGWASTLVPVLAVVIVTSVALQGLWRPWVVGLLAVAVARAVWARPGYGVGCLILLVFFVDWCTEELGLLPHEATWLIEVMVALLAVRAVAARGVTRLRGAGMELPLLLLGFGGVASALAHGQEIVSIGLGLRALLRFLIMFYVLINLDLTERQWRWGLVLVIGLVFLQAPIAAYQWGVLGKTDDQVFGSLRSTGMVAVLSVMVLCFMAGACLTRGTRAWYLLAAPLLMVVPILGEAKAFFFLLPPALLTVLVVPLVRHPIRVAGFAVLAVSLTIGALGLFAQVGGNADLRDVFINPRVTLEAAFAPPRQPLEFENNPLDVTLADSFGPRVRSIRDARAAIAGDSLTTFFGHGLGSRTFTYGEVVAQTSAILDTAPVATKLYELGYAGLLLFWFIMGSVLVSIRPLRASLSDFWRGLALGFPGVVVLYLVGDFYTDTLNDSLGFAFWFLAAGCVCQTARTSISGQSAFDS